jgi:hypothetical protein
VGLLKTAQKGSRGLLLVQLTAQNHYDLTMTPTHRTFKAKTGWGGQELGSCCFAEFYLLSGTAT